MTTRVDTSTTGKHLPALDGIRGLGVLMVMVCHVFGQFFAHGSVAGNLAIAGWMGVDMFFALSGFLLTGILYDTLGDRHYFRNFYARRSLRIFPLYYGYLLATLGVGLLLGVHFYPRMWLFFTYTDNLSSAAWWRSGVETASADWVTVDHFWSLAVEEHFYLLWPTLLFLLATRKRILTAGVALAAVCLAIRCFIQFSPLGARYPILPYIWTPTRFDGMLLGAALAMLVRSSWRGRMLSVSPLIAYTGIGITLVYCLFRTPDMLGDPWVKTIGFTLVAIWSTALIGCALQSGSRTDRFFSTPFLRFFGRYSYGIYVFHLLIMNQLLRSIPVWFRLYPSHTLAQLLPRILVFPVSVALAMLSFRFFEQPILHLKRYFHDDSHQPKLRSQLNRPQSAI